ncbi:ABC transporter permease [Roseiarcaceae bacterium H3SJ34-1]|uniref:ABC transporter permease n=1 Tax=Terripilifer ovatus TaxID=3032367 RepID=UPI003AB92727|nr:ABC transporter permease [Roseiarcaceae bacterium H3SJ34-1]
MAATIIGGLLQGGVFALLALGFALVYRVTGVVNLCQGAFCVLGALSMYTLEQTLGWPAALAATGAVVLTTLFGALLGLATFVPALNRLPNSSMLMLTAGLLTLVEGLVLIFWGSQPFNLPAFSGEAPVQIFGLRVATQAFWIVGVVAVVVCLLWYLLTRTMIGKQLRACAENPMAARLMGINVTLMSTLSFSLAAMIGAIGGIVLAPITSLQFDSGTFFTISGFIAVAIGGMGSFVGAIVGGLILGVAEQFAAGYISSLFSNGIAVILLLVALMFRPNGLFGVGGSRRVDVRDEQQVHLGIVRIQNGPAVTLSTAIVLLLAVLPWTGWFDSILPSLIITGILFIGVLGLDVLMGFAGQVSLGQGAFMAIGGYAAAILAVQYDWPPLMGVLAGIVLSLACSMGLSLVTMRLRGIYLALATLAFAMLVDSLITGWMDLTGGPSGLVGIPALSVGGYDFATPFSMYYLVLALGVVLVLLLTGLMRSSFGRALKAIRADQLAAAALDINIGRYKMAAFAISAVFASISGSLFAFNFHYLAPDMVGIPRSLEMVTMLVVGGEGMLVGPLVGVALLTLLPEVFQPLALYKTLAEGILLVMTFQYCPAGLAGLTIKQLHDVFEWFAARKHISPRITQEDLR